MTSLGLPPAECPEQVGLSSERLERITAKLTDDVERGAIPGAVLAIARAGRIGYAEAIGYRDKEAGAKMQPDAIFRIASMTKPIVSVAAMALAEEGGLDVGAPVADYIPAFKEMTVGAERTKAIRTMTVQDLLRHTSGLTYAAFGDSPVQMIWRDANLQDENQTNEDLVGKLAGLPLMFEPGTTWEYSMSTDVLGRVVEITSGKGLGDFIAKRITGPLGMADTAFAATGDKAARVAEPLIDKATGKKPPMRDPARATRWQSGGGGLVGTAADYVRFCQMLLNGGTLDGETIIGRKTLQFMASDHLAPSVKVDSPLMSPGHSFGLGFAVRTHQGMAPFAGSVGQYFWSGMAGTFFWIDPTEDLFAIFLSQGPGQREYFRTLIRSLVYATVE